MTQLELRWKQWTEGAKIEEQNQIGLHVIQDKDNMKSSEVTMVSLR